MNLKLDASVSSPEDLQALILEVQAYQAWFAHTQVRRKVAEGQNAAPTNNPAEPELSPAADTYIKSLKGIKQLNEQAFSQLLDALQDLATTAPQLTFTLAMPPSGGLKKELVAWCRDNIAPNTLVRFSFNRTLLGGMVVRSGSHIFDWSFRRAILDNRAQFPDMLRKAAGRPDKTAHPAHKEPARV